jgi:IstB-like ATP binding protein
LEVPIDRWHDIVGNSTVSDAILDRIVHNAYKIQLAGESMRKRRLLDASISPTLAGQPAFVSGRTELLDRRTVRPCHFAHSELQYLRLSIRLPRDLWAARG